MAVVNTNSTRVAADLVKGSNRPSIGKDLQLIEGRLESVGGDSIGSTYRLCTLPSDFVIDKIELANDALGGSCAADLGIYKALGGAVVDADLFGSAISLVSAAGILARKPHRPALALQRRGQPHPVYDLRQTHPRTTRRVFLVALATSFTSRLSTACEIASTNCSMPAAPPCFRVPIDHKTNRKIFRKIFQPHSLSR